MKRASSGLSFVLVAFVAACVIAAAAFVGEPISIARALSDSASLDHAILFHARLPRIALGAVAGAGLAVTGGSYQALLRNPLAEPYVLGVAGGAALGATLAIAATQIGGAALPALATHATAALAAALMGGLATLLVWFLSSRATGQAHATSILLAGVIVNAIAAGAITFVKTLVRASTAQQLLVWLAGFVDVPTPAALIVVSTCVVVGSAMLLIDAPRLNLVALGDEQAAHLGVDVRALERRVFVASSLVVGAIVSTCGMVGFVGLLVPQLVRKVCGADQRVVLPNALILGAATLVGCDLVARATFRVFGTEPPVGAITALVGGPVFLALLGRRSTPVR